MGAVSYIHNVELQGETWWEGKRMGTMARRRGPWTKLLQVFVDSSAMK